MVNNRNPRDLEGEQPEFWRRDTRTGLSLCCQLSKFQPHLLCLHDILWESASYSLRALTLDTSQRFHLQWCQLRIVDCKLFVCQGSEHSHPCIGWGHLARSRLGRTPRDIGSRASTWHTIVSSHVLVVCFQDMPRDPVLEYYKQHVIHHHAA